MNTVYTLKTDLSQNDMVIARAIAAVQKIQGVVINQGVYDLLSSMNKDCFEPQAQGEVEKIEEVNEEANDTEEELPPATDQVDGDATPEIEPEFNNTPVGDPVGSGYDSMQPMGDTV